MRELNLIYISKMDPNWVTFGSVCPYVTLVDSGENGGSDLQQQDQDHKDGKLKPKS